MKRNWEKKKHLLAFDFLKKLEPTTQDYCVVRNWEAEEACWPSIWYELEFIVEDYCATSFVVLFNLISPMNEETLNEEEDVDWVDE